MVKTKLDLFKLADQLGYVYEPRLWPKFGKIEDYEFYTDGAGQPIRDEIINYEIKVGSFMHRALNDDISGRMLSFAAGVCLFCLNNGVNLSFDRDMPNNYTHLMAVLRDDFHFPIKSEEKMQEIKQKSFDFRGFLEDLRDDINLFCDVDSAIFVYDLQGDEAIFHILCHVFTKFKRNIRFSCPLLLSCDIKKFPEISDYVSGTTFPVVVSPFSKKLRWQARNNGHFLETEIGGEWFVLDCAAVGHHIVGKESLSARKQFWTVGGDVVPYFVCYNWLDVVEAVGHFGTDVLIRDFRTDLFGGYWSKFGPNALIDVTITRRKVGVGQKFNTGVKVDWYTNDKRNCVLNLSGDIIKKESGQPCFSVDEIKDWFELGALCRTAIKK